MKRRSLIWMLRQQSRSEHIGKQVMIAIPGPGAVQRRQEKVPPLERHEPSGPIPLPGNRFAQRPAQPIEDRRLEQKRPSFFGLPVEHFFQQIVDDVPMIPCERLDEARGILVIAYRKRGKLQPGNPTFSPGIQRSNIIL